MRNLLAMVSIIVWLPLGSVAAQDLPQLITPTCDLGDNRELYDVRDQEAACLRKFAERASRTGNLLTVKLDNGTTKLFRSNPCPEINDEGKKCVDYYLVGFHAASERYMISVDSDRINGCRLLSARTGRAITLPNVPTFAPDGMTFFVNWIDRSGDWLAIGSAASDPPSITWKVGPLANQ